jgi:hypothetical protein
VLIGLCYNSPVQEYIPLSLMHIKFDEWSTEVERVVREYMSGLLVGTCTEVLERADESGVSPLIGLTLDECLIAIKDWFQAASSFARQVIENEELDLIAYELNVCAFRELVDGDAVMIRPVLGRTSQSTLSAFWVQRARADSYSALFETAEQWREWEEDELRFARTPLETLLASGEVQVLDPGAGSFSTPDHEGWTYYSGEE